MMMKHINNNNTSMIDTLQRAEDSIFDLAANWEKVSTTIFQKALGHMCVW